MKNIVFIMPFILLLFACKKEKPMADFEVNFISPLDGQEYNYSDSVKIRAEIIFRKGEMHGFEIYAYDSNSLAVWLNKGLHTHDSIVVIDTFFINKVTETSTGKVELRTYSGHIDGPMMLSRNIRLKP